MRRILNSIVNAINSNIKLPRILVVIPDMDVLKEVSYDRTGASKIIGDCINFFVEAVSRLVDTRKEDLRSAKPGAINSGEPKIIWLKVLTRPGFSQSVIENKAKFNAILEETLTNHRSRSRGV